MNMKFLLCLLVTGAAVASAHRDDEGFISSTYSWVTNQAGDIYQSWTVGYEEPPYTVDETHEEFEIRTYPANQWVCTSNVTNGVIPPPYAIEKETTRKMFMRLFNYIQGSNDRDQEIGMTIPVSIIRKTVESEIRVTMCFYLSLANQSGPPVPSDSRVFFQDRPMLTVAVKRFGGYYWVWSDFQPKAYSLQNDLIAAGKTNIDFTYFYSNGYDAPWKFWFRRNEVWFVQN